MFLVLRTLMLSRLNTFRLIVLKVYIVFLFQILIMFPSRKEANILLYYTEPNRAIQG